jgi:hypothetical protein
LTREVFLPDQSERIVEALRYVGKRYFAETLWIFVDDCARNFAQNQASNPSRSAVLPSSGPNQLAISVCYSVVGSILHGGDSKCLKQKACGKD